MILCIPKVISWNPTTTQRTSEVILRLPKVIPRVFVSNPAAPKSDPVDAKSNLEGPGSGLCDPESDLAPTGSDLAEPENDLSE